MIDKFDISTSKILITGASGSLGKQLVYELTKRDADIVAQVRRTSNTQPIERFGAEKRFADLRNRDELIEIVQGIDAVIHTAAIVNFRKNKLSEFASINTICATDLFRAAEANGVKRFVHVSTIAAVGAIPKNENQDPTKVADETFEFNLQSLKIPYIISKRAAEEELLKLAANSKTELVIVNPAIIVAPSRTGNDRKKAGVAFSKFVVPDLPINLNLVDLRDVAQGTIGALEYGRSGERYLLTGDNISGRDLVLTASVLLGKSPHLIRPPRLCLNTASHISNLWGSMSGQSKVSFYPDIVNMLDYDWVYSSNKAIEELEYRPRSVFATLDNLLSNHFYDSYMHPKI